MVESSPCCQRRPPCKTIKGMSDDAADAAALTYLLTLMSVPRKEVPNQYGDILLFREGRREREAVGDRKKA